MSVGFRYSGIWMEVGESDFLHAFFSTICYRLEANKWGSKYPFLMKKLYYEKLDPQEIPQALEEIREIKDKFTFLKPEQVIWDAENFFKRPPVSFLSRLKKASNLSECFITVGGRNLLDLMIENFQFCIRRGISIKIQSESDLIS